MPFACTICEEESTRICGYCTKDTCENHLCERCHRCSDCCECDVRLVEHPPEPAVRAHVAAGPRPVGEPEPDLEPVSEPAPDPDPVADPKPEREPVWDPTPGPDPEPLPA